MVERGEPRPALTVPQSAIQIDQAGRTCSSSTTQNKAEQRRITARRRAGPRRRASPTGSRRGERVIVEGLQKVRPGQS